MVRSVDRLRPFRAGDCNFAMSEIQVQRLQKIRMGLQNDVAACNAEVGRAIFDICWYVCRFDKYGPEALVFGGENELSRRGGILLKTDAGPCKQIQRRLEKSAFAKGD